MAKDSLVIMFFLLVRDDISWDACLVLLLHETKNYYFLLSTSKLVVNVVIVWFGISEMHDVRNRG